MTERAAFMTPPEVAKLLRVRVDKVRSWIMQGALRAVDVSEHCGGRPRYRVSADDLRAFLERRSVKPAVAAPRPRRDESIKSYV